MSDIEIRRVGGDHTHYVLSHPCDLSTLDMPSADACYDTRADAEEAAAAILATLAGGED